MYTRIAEYKTRPEAFSVSVFDEEPKFQFGRIVAFPALVITFDLASERNRFIVNARKSFSLNIIYDEIHKAQSYMMERDWKKRIKEYNTIVCKF